MVGRVWNICSFIQVGKHKISKNQVKKYILNIYPIYREWDLEGGKVGCEGELMCASATTMNKRKQEGDDDDDDGDYDDDDDDGDGDQPQQ